MEHWGDDCTSPSRLSPTTLTHISRPQLSFRPLSGAAPYIFMPAGNHEWVMDRTRLSGPKLISVIRFLDVPIYRNERWEKNNSLLIHVGNWPYQLQGCVAPGLRQTNTGVGRSALAMEAIFTLLGGFQPGKKGIATVENEQGPPA